MKLADLSVLIVDDHEGMRELLRKVLERAGVARVRDAASGAKALALLDEEPADLILVDQNMPGMSGAELVAQVRSDQRWRDARVLLITGDARAEARDADALLVKPVAPSALLAAIQRALSA